MNGIPRSAALSLLLLAGGYACSPGTGGAAVSRRIALPFIENDFSQAQTLARNANLPLFVEVWSPW